MTREKAIERLNHIKIHGADIPNESIDIQRRDIEALDMAIKALEEEPCEDGMEKHTDRQIYDGCIHLMTKMVDYFQEYLEYLGYDLDKMDEDERFAVEIFNMTIVRWLFLFHTRNSGGCSTRDFCEKIGIDGSKSVKFGFERDEE